MRRKAATTKSKFAQLGFSFSTTLLVDEVREDEHDESVVERAGHDLRFPARPKSEQSTSLPSLGVQEDD